VKNALTPQPKLRAAREGADPGAEFIRYRRSRKPVALPNENVTISLRVEFGASFSAACQNYLLG